MDDVVECESRRGGVCVKALLSRRDAVHRSAAHPAGGAASTARERVTVRASPPVEQLDRWVKGVNRELDLPSWRRRFLRDFFGSDKLGIGHVESLHSDRFLSPLWVSGDR